MVRGEQRVEAVKAGHPGFARFAWTVLGFNLPSDVHRAPDGTRLGRIDTGQRTSNCNWGDDGSTLYITADSYLCRIRTKTKGLGW